MIKKQNTEDIEKVLNTVADFMIENRSYDEIGLYDLEKNGIAKNIIKKTVDSNILLSRKLVFHEGTIARSEKEVIYFVFDEMRDYYLARRILLKNVSADSVNEEAVLNKLRELNSEGVSCAEGVIHYCYIFFRTDKTVEKMGRTEKICNNILDLYRISEKRTYWGMRHRDEFQNLGIRIILTSGIELNDFEIAYIQDCLRKNPGEDGGIIFDTMLEGTLHGGIYNLDIYLDILLGLRNEKAILNAFRQVGERNMMEEYFIPTDLIRYYNKVENIEQKLQIQKVTELFLLCFELKDADDQKKIEQFFYNLPLHSKIYNDMYLKMKTACNLEVHGNE